MESKRLQAKAKPRANYPHVKRVGDLIFVSGTSSRRPDNSIAGAEVDEMGTRRLDIRLQTEAVIENIRDILVSVDARLEDIADMSCFLVSINDFGGFNEVYNRYFDPETGPTRTTVAVHQLPHPQLLVEMKATAYRPIKSTVDS